MDGGGERGNEGTGCGCGSGVRVRGWGVGEVVMLSLPNQSNQSQQPSRCMLHRSLPRDSSWKFDHQINDPAHVRGVLRRAVGITQRLVRKRRDELPVCVCPC